MTTVTVCRVPAPFSETGAVTWPYASEVPNSTQSAAPALPPETVAVTEAWWADRPAIAADSTTAGVDGGATPGACVCSASR